MKIRFGPVNLVDNSPAWDSPVSSTLFTCQWNSNATHSQRVARYGPEGHVPYMCLTGQTLIGTAGGSTQLTTSCQANGAFTAVSSSLQWIGAPLPSETGVFNDVVNPVQEDITNS